MALFDVSLSDVLFTGETIQASTVYDRSASDTVSVTDAAFEEFLASASDNITITETLLTETSYVRSASDTLAVSDIVAAETIFPQDTISVTDTVSTDGSYVRPNNDTVTLTDLVTLTTTFERSASDTVSVTDAPVFIEVAFHDDTISVTDSTLVTVFFSRAASDTASVTDQVSTVSSYERLFAETLVVSDTVDAVRSRVLDVSINETAISLTDSSIADITEAGDASDNISIADTILRDVSYVRDLSDTLVLTEQLLRTTSFERSGGNDTVSVTDQTTAELTKGRSVSDTVSVTDQLDKTVFFGRNPSDAMLVTDQIATRVFKFFDETFSDSISVAGDFVLAEVINIDVDLQDTLFEITDQILRETTVYKTLSDTISVTDVVSAERGGVVDRTAQDTISVTDTVKYILQPGVLPDAVGIVDTVLVENISPLPVVLDSNGFGFTIELPVEIRYDGLHADNFDAQPLGPPGVPFQVEGVDPIVEPLQFGQAGEVVYGGGQNYFSNVFRISGASASSTSAVSGKNVTASESVSLFDSYKIEVLGPDPVTIDSGFGSSDVNRYIEIDNGAAPGVYRILSLVDVASVVLDRPLPVVDSANGSLSWMLTSAVQALHFRTTNKITNQANYSLRARGLLEKDGTHYGFEKDFLSTGINGPRLSGVTVTDEGVVLAQYDQPMKSDRDLVFPGEYTITGPTDVMVKRAWSVSSTLVALETLGLGVGSYALQVNYAGTPKDVAGNPIDPIFSEAIFTGDVALKTRSVFTDKGPISKPPLVLAAGFGATINTTAEVLLPGASLVSGNVGLYVRLGDQGLPPTTSSSVLGNAVTINDAAYATDSLKVEKIGPASAKTVYTSLSGTYKILGVLSPTRARLQASFSFPEASSGSLYWELVDPRNGEIADDPSDVTVLINGAQVAPQAVIGLLGQVVLNASPLPEDDVKVAYSWCCNPTVEFRQLNSKEFRLNSWNNDQGYGASPTQHRYRYNNVLINPSDYETLSVLATLAQPELRELHYRAYERAYTPVLNDPTLLLLNSPIHKIAFPAAQRTLTEEFVAYEATVLPDNDPEPWVRHGTGLATVSAGVLTVTDNSSGVFPDGQPLFWTRDIDLTFPHAFAMSWRFSLDSVPTFDGVFSGVAAGYSDDIVAYVVGFLEVSGTRKIGFLKRGSGDDPSLVGSWTGGVDLTNTSTGAPVDFDWSVLHSYRIFRDRDGTVRLFVDGDVLETLRIVPDEAPFLDELNAPFDEIQGSFFGSLSRPAQNVSSWDFVRYLILPTNPLQTSPSSFVSYEGNVHPETDARPWTPIGFHGTETILANTTLLLDSTSATDASTESAVGLMGGDFLGFVRMEPLLTSASQVVLDVSVQQRTYTQGVDPYGLMFAVDDGSRLTQVAFFPDRATPKFSYGGRSLPEDFSPYVWTALGGATAAMVGRILRITDAAVGDGKVYFIDDVAPPASDDRVISVSTDYILEFRNHVISYTVDGSGFAGVFGQVDDGTRSVGLMLEDIAGTLYVAFHSDGVPLGPSARFAFNWNDGNQHTYRFSKSTGGDLVSLFIDGLFIGTTLYSLFAPSGGTALVSFGSSTPSSAGALSVVDWSYCNAWRLRSDLRHYVGIWKGSDDNALTGYHLPLKASGSSATIVGNALGDALADFTGDNVVAGDLLIVDFGDNKGVYEVASVGGATNLTIVGTWPSNPSLVSYRIAREIDWTTQHKYRLLRDSSGEVTLTLENDSVPLIRVGYNSIDLPISGSGIIKQLTNGLAAIAFGSFSPENLEQSNWDFVRYGISRSPTEIRIAPHHQFLNQQNVMESPERLFTALPHELTNYQSSSTGIVPKKDPDFLRDPGLPAFTQLNDSTPLVPSTQTFEVRSPHPVQEPVAALNDPADVLNTDGAFVLNDGSVRYRLVIPDDVLYSSLDVIEQATGEEQLIAPFGDQCNPAYGGVQYVKETCLTYDANVLPENDSTAPTPWVRESDVPSQVSASVSGGVLTYGTTGSRTVYKNNTPLPDAPSLTTQTTFRLRLANDATLGTGDTQVRFGMSAPGMTVALAFVTTPHAERYVLAVDLNNGNCLGSVSFNFLDGNYHDYKITRDPGAGLVRISIDS